VKITGVAVALLEIPAEFTQEYNHWYDLDHMPEHVSKPDVVMGRRYVATPALRAHAGVTHGELTSGHPPYATVYFFGGPLDFMSSEAFDGWREMDRGITRAGRFWTHGRPVFTSWWRLAGAHARPSIHVSEPAIAHLAHQGVIFSIGRARSAEQRAQAVEWWERTQRDDLYEVPGLLATLQFEPVETGEQDLVLHILLCSEPAATVLEGIRLVREKQALTARYPAFGGVYETVALLPYERIVALQYDFDMGSSEQNGSPLATDVQDPA
jgi:hypothetical protein